MTIGILQLDLFIPQINSLKSKRQVIKSLKDRIRSKFNTSIAEIDNADKWQKQLLAVVCVSNDKRSINSQLSKVVNLIEANCSVELVDFKIEII